MCVCVCVFCVCEGYRAGLTPTFLSKSPTMFRAVMRVEGVKVLGLPPRVLLDDVCSTDGVDAESPVQRDTEWMLLIRREHIH